MLKPKSTPVFAVKHKDKCVGAWSALYTTTSQPFAPPETGKIAVKVINHYGDEVLKVYQV